MEKDIKTLVLEAIMSKEFRQEMIKDPDKAISQRGYKITADELAALESLNLEEWDSMTVKELGKRFQKITPAVRGIPIEPDEPGK